MLVSSPCSCRKFWFAFRFGVVLDDDHQLPERRDQRSLGRGLLGRRPGGARGHRASARDVLEHLLLVGGVALDRLDQVRDQVVSTPELGVDVRPRVLDEGLLRDEPVVRDDGGDRDDARSAASRTTIQIHTTLPLLIRERRQPTPASSGEPGLHSGQAVRRIAGARPLPRRNSDDSTARHVRRGTRRTAADRSVHVVDARPVSRGRTPSGARPPPRSRCPAPGEQPLDHAGVEERRARTPVGRPHLERAVERVPIRGPRRRSPTASCTTEARFLGRSTRCPATPPRAASITQTNRGSRHEPRPRSGAYQ